MGKKDEPIMSSLDTMHHIAPYPKSQFILSLSTSKKRFYQANDAFITCLAMTDFVPDACTYYVQFLWYFR